jgi:hypothetical protein
VKNDAPAEAPFPGSAWHAFAKRFRLPLETNRRPTAIATGGVRVAVPTFRRKVSPWSVLIVASTFSHFYMS